MAKPKAPSASAQKTAAPPAQNSNPLSSLPLPIFGIILANLILLAQGLSGQWVMAQYLLVYWCESAIIGFFTLLKMWMSENKSKSEMSITTNGKTEIVDAASLAGRLPFMAFFCIHFGLFMLVHLIFLLVWLELDLSMLLPILWGAGILFISHAFSFYFHFILGGERKSQPIGKIFFSPYPRVIFMHLVVILGAIFSFWPPLVVAIKIGADIFGHNMSHQYEEKEEEMAKSRQKAE